MCQHENSRKKPLGSGFSRSRISAVFLFCLVVLSSTAVHADCSEENAMLVAEGRSAAITFENKTSQALALYQLDRNGVRQFHDTLEPSSRRTIPTTEFVRWLVARKTGECVSIFKSDGNRTYPITEFLLDSITQASRPIRPTPQSPTSTPSSESAH